MLITINSVAVSTAPKGYQVADVSYTKDGKAETKKIMSFAAPAVFASLNNLKNFPVDVTVTVKKEGAYWNWKELSTDLTSGATSTNVPKSAGTKVTGSNYETSEERARRQIYIIRQSSVSSAIEYLKATNPKGVEKSVQEVLEIASQIEAHVVNVEPQLATKPI